MLTTDTGTGLFTSVSLAMYFVVVVGCAGYYLLQVCVWPINCYVATIRLTFSFPVMRWMVVVFAVLSFQLLLYWRFLNRYADCKFLRFGVSRFRIEQWVFCLTKSRKITLGVLASIRCFLCWFVVLSELTAVVSLSIRAECLSWFAGFLWYCDVQLM